MTGNPALPVLLTRPKVQAQAYGAELSGTFGDKIRPVCSPLIEIVPTGTPIELTGVAALLFTSANGVTVFAASTDRRDIPALCVGEKTRAVAVSLGFEAKAADGGVNGLIALAAATPQQAGECFLYPRGRHAARAIAEPLRKLGKETREIIIYEQREIPLTNEAQTLIRETRPLILPLFSARTAGLFLTQTKGADLSNVTVVCISQNVADNLPKTAFSRVLTASTPDGAAVTREIAAIL